MTCETWTSDTSLDYPPCNILVTIEHCDTFIFHEFVSRLVASRRLSRIVIDEPHLALTHDTFRDIMGTLQWLGSMDCQIALLSATVPPSLVEALFAKFGITQYVVCREKTSRPNISFNVIRSYTPRKTLDDKVREVLAKAGTDKAIIFCRSREEAESTAKQLGFPCCHGYMTKEEIEVIVKQLRAGEVRAIVCTTVLGVSLDVEDIAWAFHLDYPYDMMSFIQESGRAGRTPGMPAFSYVIIPQYSYPQYPKPDRFGAKLIHDWAANTTYCRRWLMQLFNDGVAEPCSMMVGISHMCDVCKAAQLIRPDRGVSSTPSVDVIDQYLPLSTRQ
jgi:hypothetical protein